MSVPKKILNKAEDAVDEFVQGLLYQFPNKLVKLASHHVILRSDYESTKLAIFSGGGSGHEPSHAGWIGDNMLTGAILGGMFASPSIASIAATCRVATKNSSSRDVLLIVKNYTGDRLNFGMAAERVNQELGSSRIKMVVVADDCALPRTKGITGARGVAGTVLVHKIAGAAASTKSLDEVVDLANAVCQNMGTLGVALDTVTVPGSAANDRVIPSDKMEVGLGIHGEAGMKQTEIKSADDMAAEMVATIQKHGRIVDDKVVPIFEPNDEVVILVNNLGGTSNFELSLFARSCVAEIEKTAKVSRVYVGTYMTSFNMHGVSLTILNATAEMLEYLDAPTSAPAWVAGDVWNIAAGERPSFSNIPLVEEAKTTTEEAELPPVTLPVDISKIVAATQKLAEAEPMLTKYDTIVGDGDCGITMKRGATKIMKRLEGQSDIHPVKLFALLADAVSDSMGGTSGVLLELMLRKMGSTLSSAKTIGQEAYQRAFVEGVQAVGLYGGATVGSRTMLDALVPAAKAGSLADAAKAARAGADQTAAMKVASAGRSNYLSEDTLDGTPDPGAVAVAIILEGLYHEA